MTTKYFPAEDQKPLTLTPEEWEIVISCVEAQREERARRGRDDWSDLAGIARELRRATGPAAP